MSNTLDSISLSDSAWESSNPVYLETDMVTGSTISFTNLEIAANYLNYACQGDYDTTIYMTTKTQTGETTYTYSTSTTAYSGSSVTANITNVSMVNTEEQHLTFNIRINCTNGVRTFYSSSSVVDTCLQFDQPYVDIPLSMNVFDCSTQSISESESDSITLQIQKNTGTYDIKPSVLGSLFTLTESSKCQIQRYFVVKKTTAGDGTVSYSNFTDSDQEYAKLNLGTRSSNTIKLNTRLLSNI